MKPYSRPDNDKYRNRFNPQKAITRAELAAVIDKACQVYLATRGYKTLQGTIGNSSFVTGPSVERNYYQVVRDDGQSFFMVVDSERDFLVYKNRSLGRSGFLNTGDSVKVQDGPQKEILLVEAAYGTRFPGRDPLITWILLGTGSMSPVGTARHIYP